MLSLLKHKNNADVAMFIQHQRLRNDNKGYIANITWFNVVNPKNIFFIKHDTVFIKLEDLNNWLPYEPLD